MHQVEPVTKIVHLLNAHENSDSIKTCVPSQLANETSISPSIISNNCSINHIKVSKKLGARAVNDKEKLQILGSELSSVQNIPKSTTRQSYTYRSKSSLQFDIRQIKATKLKSIQKLNISKVFHEKSKMYYEISPGSIPVFKIQKQTAPDPLSFYESVRDLGTRYGCVKVIFHETGILGQHGVSQPCNEFVVNPDQLWFKTNTQFPGSIKQNRKHMLQFYANLFEFYQLRKSDGNGLTKVPSINKRTLDLYRLFNCVQLRGGYDAVCQEKLWAQIGRELGYSGRIMSSLSTSLRLAYAKVLLEYEQHLKKIESRLDQNSIQETKNVGSKGYEHFNVANSTVEYNILRDLNKTKHNIAEYERIQDNERHNNKLFKTNINLWCPDLEVYDDDDDSIPSSPIYNLKQFHEKSEKHFQDIRLKYATNYPELNGDLREFEQSSFENMFLEISSGKKFPYFVDTGLNLDSKRHNFGTLFVPNASRRVEAIQDAWNLENIPLQVGSLLHNLDIDFRHYTKTTLDIGMLFSVRGWHLNGNFLSSINYNHLGSTKVWYIIPAEDMEKFEKLVHSINSKNRKQNEVDEIKSLLNDTFEHSELYKCYCESLTSLRDVAYHEIHPKGVNGAKTTNPSIFLPGDLQFHPEFLRENDINFYTATQECGAYILTFPKVYTTNVGSGFSLSENALFAPSSWLNFLLEGERWFNRNVMLPGILPFQFLLNVVSLKDNASYDHASRILKCLVKEELANRAKIKEMIPTLKVVENKFDFISDLSLRPTGGSKVVIYELNHTISLSYEEFSSLFVDHNLKASNKFEEMSICLEKNMAQNSSNDFQLHIYCSDATLQSVLSEDGILLEECDPDNYFTRIYEKLHILFQKRKIPLESLEEIASKIDLQNPVFAGLDDMLFDARVLLKDCDAIISMLPPFPDHVETPGLELGQGLKLIKPLLSQGQLNLGFVQSTLDRIKESQIEFPRMIEVLNIGKKISKFQVDLETSLKSKDLAALKRTCLLGISLGIRRDSLKPLLHYICRTKWLESYSTYFEGNSGEELIGYNINDLNNFLEYGINFCGTEEMDKLQKIKGIIMESQNVIQKINNMLNVQSAKNVFSIKEVDNILNSISVKNLPIDRNVINLLELISTNANNVRKKLSPLFELVNINVPFEHELSEHIKNNSIELLHLLPKFNGSEDDKRICMSDFQSEKFFADRIKSSKAWMNKVGKLFTKSRREKFRRSVANHLQVEDDPCNKNLSPSEQERYCFCRQGDIGGTMIECEICKEWYHTNCVVSSNWELSHDVNSVFVCSICCDGNKPLSENLIQYSDIKRLVLESIHLALIPDRQMLNDIFSIFKTLFMFEQAALKDVLIMDGECSAGVALNTVKHYLRKLEKSNCQFSSWDSILKRYCQEQNSPLLQELRTRNVVILGNDQGIYRGDQTATK